MNKKYNSLNEILITRILFFFFITIFFVFTFSYMYIRNIINDNFEHTYSNEFSSIVSIIENDRQKLIKTLNIEKYQDSFKRNVMRKIRAHVQRNKKQDTFFIIDKEGRVNILSGEDGGIIDSEGFKNVIDGNPPESFNYKVANDTYWVKIVSYRQWKWKIGVVVSHKTKYLILRRFLSILLIFTLVMMIIVALFLYFVISETIKPVYQLKDHIVDLSKGNLEKPFDKDLHSIELIELSRALENMRINMNRYINNIKEESERRRVAEKMFRKLFENLPIAFELFDEKKERILANKAWYSMWNIDEESKGDFIIKGEYQKILEQAISGENTIAKEINVIGSVDEQVRTFRVYAVALDEVSSKENYVIFLSIDITETKKMQELLIQNEKMMSVGGLAAGMAHEINNPLSGIIVGIQNIRRRIDKNRDKNIKKAEKVGISLDNMSRYFKENDIDNMIEGIFNSAIRASDIVLNMLEFSRSSNAERKIVSIEFIIEESIKLLEKYFDISKYDFHQVEIVRDFSKVPEVGVVRTEIEQVFVNLMKNATRALFDSKKEDKKIIIRLFSEKNNIVIKFKDNGIGMDKNTMKRIFEPFYTRNSDRKGTGLGLSIVYFIITRNHKGEITVDSKQGEWTEFTIRLPMEIEVE